jgi:Sec-independent protein translocase protein TatA
MSHDYLQWKSSSWQQQNSLVDFASRHITDKRSLLQRRRQRRSVACIETQMALFGLGGAEIAVVLVAVVLVMGPNQLGKMAGNMTGRIKGEYKDLPEEWKKIPKEFQMGLEESTENARARNAKLMERVPDDENGDDEK